MSESAIANNPGRPPKRFEHEEELGRLALLLTSLQTSSRFGALKNISLLWQKPAPCTASWISPVELYVDRSHAEKRARPDNWQAITKSASLFGDFQPIVMHTDADGTEMIESLPDEPEPVSRKRQIRHG